jgi:lipopolysaccharide export system permease protein
VAQAHGGSTGPDAGAVLPDVARTRFSGGGVARSQGEPGALPDQTGAQLRALVRADPRQQSLAGLRAAIRQLEAGGASARRQRFAFWSQLARLAAIPLAMLLSVPLVIGRLGRAGAGARVAVALLLGMSYFIAQRILESSALAFDLSPLLLAWLPTLLLAAAVPPLLWRTRRLSAA